MILKKKIPKEFYKLFRTKNRDAYMQFLVAIYEENNYNILFSAEQLISCIVDIA